jgi:hypothetical protein
MMRLFTCALILIGFGTIAMPAISKHTAKLNTNSEARLATDGAFRDGLYLGKLAAESGQPAHPAIGRWSTSQDRTTFLAGYSRGYEQSLTSAAEQKVTTPELR